VDDKGNPIPIHTLMEIPRYNGEKTHVPPITQFFIASSESKIFKSKNGFLDQIRSDVIECSRCILQNGNLLFEGRIWVEPRYYDENGIIKNKEAWLAQKFNAYRSWIKKNFRISADKSAYIGAEAYALKTKGHRMMNGPNVEVMFD